MSSGGGVVNMQPKKHLSSDPAEWPCVPCQTKTNASPAPLSRPPTLHIGAPPGPAPPARHQPPRLPRRPLATRGRPRGRAPCAERPQERHQPRAAGQSVDQRDRDVDPPVLLPLERREARGRMMYWRAAAAGLHDCCGGRCCSTQRERASCCCGGECASRERCDQRLMRKLPNRS
jgi:hypothetical protein